MSESQYPQSESCPKYLPAGSRLIHPPSALLGSAPDGIDFKWWAELRKVVRGTFSSRTIRNPDTKGLIQGTGIEVDILKQFYYWLTKLQPNGDLMGYERHGRRWIWITLDYLADQTGYTRQRISDAIRNLYLLGWIERKQPMKHRKDWTYHYTVLWERIHEVCPLNNARTGLCRSNDGGPNHHNETSITTSNTPDSLQKKELPGTGAAGASSSKPSPANQCKGQFQEQPSECHYSARGSLIPTDEELELYIANGNRWPNQQKERGR